METQGKLYIVPTPVGNLEDMTYRAVKVLKEADLILAEDTRTSSVLLKHYDIHGKLQSHHKFNEHQTASVIKDRILLDFTANLLLQALYRQFKKLDCQNLKRRHLLCLLYFKTLLYHSSPSIILLISDLPMVG